MKRLCTLFLAAAALGGCGGRQPATPAQPRVEASTTTNVGGAVLQASTLDVANLNEAVANRYRIPRGSSGMLLLVTVRDAAGNGIDPGNLRLQALAGTLTDPPSPLALRPITTAGLTDYIGVVNVSPPATVRFRISAVRNGARAEMAITSELYPR